MIDASGDSLRRFLCRALALVLMAALVGMPVTASPASTVSTPLGMMLLADIANSNMDTASSGATLYDGDHLKTESNGILRARLGGSQLYLGPSSIVEVHGILDGFSADLIEGTITVSSNTGRTFQLLACGIRIQPATQEAATVQVTRISAHELLLAVNRAVIRVSAGDETKIVEAGSSYRVVVESEGSNLGDAGGDPPQGRGPHPPEGGDGPKSTGKSHGSLIIITVGIATAAAAIGVVAYRATLSPSGL